MYGNDVLTRFHYDKEDLPAEAWLETHGRKNNDLLQDWYYTPHDPQGTYHPY